MVSVGRNIQILAEAQVHILCFIKGGTIDHCTDFLGTVSQSIIESYYNASFNSVMASAHFIMIKNELINKDQDLVPEQGPLIILDRRSAVCMYGQ